MAWQDIMILQYKWDLSHALSFYGIRYLNWCFSLLKEWIQMKWEKQCSLFHERMPKAVHLFEFRLKIVGHYVFARVWQRKESLIYCLTLIICPLSCSLKNGAGESDEKKSSLLKSKWKFCSLLWALKWNVKGHGIKFTESMPFTNLPKSIF
jgi:hypothetical protein